jgi:hypothetical protein
MIGIYKITNPNGKIYIGQSVNVDKRLKEYKYVCNCKNQPKLYNSLKKYGFTKHIFEVIEECKIGELNTRERYWQEFYHVIGKEGLNCKLTETIDKSGRMSQEAIQTHWKSVLQYTSKGILIQEWKSVKEAGETLNIFRSSISKCIKGKGKSAGGFIWRYKTNTVETSIQVGKVGNECKSENKQKLTIQYSKTGTIIEEWNSAKEAGEALKIKTTNITSCCRGEIKSAGGFIWKYKN